MIVLAPFADRNAVILGLGRSGMACARALLASGASVATWDDAEAARTKAAAEGIPVREPAAIDWQAADFLVISPGIPHTHPRPHPVAAAARAAGKPIIGDIELLAQTQVRARYVGITGTNGKSTTTSLLGHILAEAGRTVQVGGNLGLPALDMAPLAEDGVYVIEMSSYQLELTPSTPFDVAVLINISPDHLGRHGGMEGYVAAKRKIFGKVGSTAVVGLDDEWSRRIAEGNPGRARTIGISAATSVPGGVSACGGILADATEGASRTVADLRAVATLQGIHNWQNAACAFAAARALDVPAEAIVRGIRSYPGLAHRQELVGQIRGVAFVNDSKATNADAAVYALACRERIHWIIGGRAKEGGLAGVEPYLGRVVRAYLIGEAAPEFADWLKHQGGPAFELCGDLASATRRAFAAAAPGDTVLLSPACASFDQFPNFEARGDAFRSLVRALAQEVAA